MGNLNKVFLIGRLGADPEPRTITGTSGRSVLNMTLASNEFYKDGAGNKQQKTEWHRVVLWGRLAEVVSQYCHKGSQLFMEGSLQTREWQDKDGNKRYTTEIVGKNIQLLDPKSQSQESASVSGLDRPSNYPGHQTSIPPKSETRKFEPKDDDDVVEDDIPF